MIIVKTKTSGGQYLGILLYILGSKGLCIKYVGAGEAQKIQTSH